MAKNDPKNCPHPFRNGTPEKGWECFTCGHREPAAVAK